MGGQGPKGKAWISKLEEIGEKAFRGRFLQQFAALFYKNGERRCLLAGALHGNARQRGD